MDYIQNTVHYVQSIPVATWQALGAYLLASGTIATALQLLKRKFGIDSKHVITGLLGVMSFLASTADYLINNSSVPPLPGITHVWAYLLAGAVVLHRFAVSPAWTKTEVVLKNFAEKVSLEQQRQSILKPLDVPSLEQ